jgi:outer membrane lipase/esterase
LPGVADNGIATLVEQAVELVGDHGSSSADALFVVWGGGNDVREAGVLAAGGNLAGATQVIGAALNNIATSISILASHGAERFLVPNLPNLAITPAAIAGGPAVQFGAQMLSSGFNQGLDQTITGLSAGLGVSILRLDVFALANRIVAHPAQFGFANVTDGCAFAGGGLGCSNPDEYAFWDAIHPTAAFHSQLALTAVPAPAAVWLFASTAFVFGLARSRAGGGRRAATPRFESRVSGL